MVKIPTSYQVNAVSAKTGLAISIIRELYSTFSSIYADSGNLGTAQDFGQTVAQVDVKRSLRHVFSLLILWLKENKDSKLPVNDPDFIWNRETLTSSFRNAAINLVRGVPNCNKWDGNTPPLSEIIGHLPDTKDDWKTLMQKTPIDPATDNPLPEEISIDSNNTSTEHTQKVDFSSLTNLAHPAVSKEKLGAFREDLLIPEETITEILTHLESGRHILLAGAIGTGKSSLARMIGGFWEDPPSFDGKHGYVCSEYSANSDWNTQDVVGGIVPFIAPSSDEEKEDSVGYKYHDGCFLKTLKKNLHWDGASWNPDQTTEDGRLGTWLVIDEFNRADIDKAFGPILSALQSGTLSVPDHPDPGHDEIPIPKNFRIIATLNTSDKHYLYKISDALKRRFAYVEIKTPPLQKWEDEIKIAYTQAGGGNNSGNLEVFYRAWKILNALRTVKGIGTGVLKSIYESILVGIERFGMTEDRALDAALTANLIPQMDSLSEEALDMMSIIHFSEDPVKELDEIRTDMAKSARYNRVSGIAHIAAITWNSDHFRKAIASDEFTKLQTKYWDEWSKNRGGSEKAWNNLKTLIGQRARKHLVFPEFETALIELKNQASM